jgi:putative hydrolase of the HAD superfamily
VPAGLSEALDRAAQSGIRLGVVSNSEGHLAALFDRLDLSRHFEHVVDSAPEGVRKPDPEIFRRALVRFGVDAAQALYAGDIPQVDVDGARAAGMEAVLIDPLNHYSEYTSAPRLTSVVELLSSFTD